MCLPCDMVHMVNSFRVPLARPSIGLEFRWVGGSEEWIVFILP